MCVQPPILRLWAALALVAGAGLALPHAPTAGPDAGPEIIAGARVLRGDLDEVLSVAFSPDGKWLATAGVDYLVSQTGETPYAHVEIWELATGRRRHTLRGPRDGFVHQVAFWPPAATVALATVAATGMRQQPRVDRWDAATGRLRGTLTLEMEGQGLLLALAPNGGTVAGASEVASAQSGSVQLWEGPTGALRRQFRTPDHRLFSLSFSPAGDTLVTSGSRATAGRITAAIRLWDARSGRLRRTLPVPGAQARHAILSRGGARLAASGSENGAAPRIWLWEGRSGRLLRSITTEEASIDALAFSPDGNFLAYGSGRVFHARQKRWSGIARVRLWSLAQSRFVHTLAGFPSSVSALAFSPDGRLLAAGSRDGTARLWRLR